MKFTTGDAIVHPVRGVGIVERIAEHMWRGSTEWYYRIKLLGQSGTRLMIPTNAGDKLGLRHVISRSTMKQLWHWERALTRAHTG